MRKRRETSSLASISERGFALVTPKLPTQDEIAKGYDDYALALGSLVHASNRLQYALGELYDQIVRGDSRISTAVWDSIISDRTQRVILRAALLGCPKHIWEIRLPTARGDIKWLIDKADNIANDRNDAVHTPCIFKTKEGRSEVVAIATLSQRSKNLQNKRLIKEFKFFEDTADLLYWFAVLATHALSDNSATWPQKPLLPTRDQPPTAKTSRRQ